MSLWETLGRRSGAVLDPQGQAYNRAVQCDLSWNCRAQLDHGPFRLSAQHYSLGDLLLFADGIKPSDS